MSLETQVTKKVTHELLAKVLMFLSSISSPLSPAEIDETVKTVLTPHPSLRFSANNDLGLCITRIESAGAMGSVQDDASLESLYAEVRDSDPLVSELLQDMALGIAKRLSGPLYDLRVVLPQEAKALTVEIESRLPPEAKEDLPPLRRFSWGQLGSSAYRESSMLFAQDRLKCFPRGSVTAIDTDRIYQALPYGGFETIASVDTIKPVLVKALTDITPDASDQSLTIGLITSPQVFRKWVSDAREQLRSGPIGEAVVSVTDRIDAICERLQKIDATMLTSLGEDVNAISSSLLANMETVLNNIQLIRASMLYHKEKTLSDRILLTPQVVQEHLLERFCEEGGSEAAVRDYVGYLRLNSHIQFQPNGITVDTVRTLQTKARETVSANIAKLNGMTRARRAVALQESLMSSLDTYYRTKIEQAGHNRATLNHDQKRHQALIALRQKPVETIALEYLAAMRADPLSEKLFEFINGELISVVKTETTITPTHVAQATCRAVSQYLLTELTHRFSPRVPS